MALRSVWQRLLLAALAATAITGCDSENDPLPPTAPIVFRDDFGTGVRFEAFAGVPAGAAIAVDPAVRYAGSASLRVDVPAGGWNGGAFPSETVRDLSAYDALSFRVKASRAIVLDVVGFGNDNTGTSLYTASRNAVAVGTDWSEVVVPIPLAAKLSAERGLFYFADGETGASYSIWFDDVEFVDLGERLGAPRPSIRAEEAVLELDATRTVADTTVTFAVDDADVLVAAMPGYFTFASSAPAVASVDAKGVIVAESEGEAVITAKLGDVDATGAVNVTVGQAIRPAVAAPAPDEAAEDVIALYSNAYEERALDTLGTDWSNGGAGPRLTELAIGGNDLLKYEDLSFAGIEFTGANLVNASEMTHFHVDVWTQDATRFGVKLVDFGANGVWQGTPNDDSEAELVFNASSTPPLTQGGWVSLDIPLSAFGGLASRAHLAQLVISSDDGNVFLDNLYFYAGDVVEPPAGPEFPVIFEDAYATGVTFHGWSGAPVVDTAVAHAGTSSLRLDVPAEGFIGGAFRIATPRDLSAYTAVTFWAKASKPTAALNVAGLGHDGAEAPFMVERGGIPLTDAWQKIVLPLPTPALLASEDGLFHVAEGSEGAAYSIWIDDVRYENLSLDLSSPQPAIATETRNLEVGAGGDVVGMSITYPGLGATFAVARPYFTYASSNTDAATVAADGKITAVGVGTAVITARFDGIDAAGAITVNVSAPPAVTTPATPAPAPAHAAGDVIALFSDAYTPVAVSTWSAGWDQAGGPEDVPVDGNATKKYTDLVFAGIEFTSPTIDATAMTHFHLDVWTPNGTQLRVKLVDFGGDGLHGGGDDREHELTFDATTTPALAIGEWVSLDIPLASFTGLTTRGHLAQLILSSSNATVFFDNLYFHK